MPAQRVELDDVEITEVEVQSIIEPHRLQAGFLLFTLARRI